MDQHRHATAATLDDRGGAAGLEVERRAERIPMRVDVRALLGQPVGDLERRVVQRTGERIAKLGTARGRVQLEEQPADAGARELRPQDPDRERDRHEEERGERGPLEERRRPEPDHVEGERDSEQDDGDAEADERRRERPAHGRRRRAPAPDEDRDRRDDQNDSGRLRELDDPVGQLRPV